MESISASELNALISLLDDTDEEVLEHVTDKLTQLGMEGIPMLENAWEHASNDIIQKKLEDLIDNIQFRDIFSRFSNWIATGADDLLEGSLLVAKCHYPELDERKIRLIIDSIVRNVWLHLTAGMSPLEEVRVINKVLFTDLGYNGNKQPEPEPDLAYLNKVIESRHGNSLGLGILYLIVARALDLNIYGVNLPYHFILCYSDRLISSEELESYSAEEAVKFYINPLLDGAPFSRTEITRYLERTGLEPQPKYFAPCDNLDIIHALVANQISCYEGKGDDRRLKKMNTLHHILTKNDTL